MKVCVCDGVQMCFSWGPSNAHLTATIFWYLIAGGSIHNLCICVRLSTQEKLHHGVCLCIWFLLISASLLPVYLTHFLNCPLPCDKDNSQTWYICILNESSSKLGRKSTSMFLLNHKSLVSTNFFFFLIPLLTSPFCCSVLWRCCVWAWTSSSCSFTRSGFAAGDARVTIPRTPIHTPSSPVLTAAAPPGASSSPRLSAGERLYTEQ